MSKSFSNLLDLASGNFPSIEPVRRLSRVMTMPSMLSEMDDNDQITPSPVAKDRIIIVSNELPLRAERTGQGWNFSWDEDSLMLQLKVGFPPEMEVIYVGTLCIDVEDQEQEEISRTLVEQFKCVPAFFPPGLHDKFYHGFCKQYLWPLFHYKLPFPNGRSRFDRSLWEAYITANRIFSQLVREVINPESDYVWIHDYHLMVLPSFLRRRFNNIRMGFFLHSSFPTSEIYRTIPVCEDILKALLNCDLIGFHTFDYARHFLSCCSRMLGHDYESKRGYISLDYFGRTVGIKIMPVGIHIGQLEEKLKLPDTELRITSLRRELIGDVGEEGRTVLLGVDDMDIFKGINLKLLAFELMLRQHPSWRGNAVLVQIANPPRGHGHDVEVIQAEIQETCNRINQDFSNPDYQPVVFLDHTVPVVERIAYYAIAECVIVTPVRDGMNLTPYEYIVCRQGVTDPNAEAVEPKRSMLVISEFIGCSPSLSGAIRVNPWDIERTAEAMNGALTRSDKEKQLGHEKHYRYVSTHDVAYWSRSFLQDLERTCKDHFTRRYVGTGLSFDFRVVALDPDFCKLNVNSVVSAYEKARRRAIFLDYDGTLMAQRTANTTPSHEVISIINTLCADTRNTVFIVSGRGRENLAEWFSLCPRLSLAAEHGYFLRWGGGEGGWETRGQSTDFCWMQIAEPVMQLYTEATDGSSIETKESSLVWHYQDADPEFGSAQAKDMLDHLENVFANEPVSVRRGKFIVEIKPQGATKGLVAENVLSVMDANGGAADFVLAVGNDRSDEDMFERMSGIMRKGLVSPNATVFACTVGQKPSRAQYYLDDTVQILQMLEALAASPHVPSITLEESETSSSSLTPSLLEQEAESERSTLQKLDSLDLA